MNERMIFERTVVAASVLTALHIIIGQVTEFVTELAALFAAVKHLF